MSTSLPAKYDEAPRVDPLPDTPFMEMSEGHVCVQAEGFKYTGRIAIPESAKRNSTAGKVVDAHPKSKYKRGDRVLYSQFAGYLFNFKGAAGMRVMGETEILGLLKPEMVLEDGE